MHSEIGVSFTIAHLQQANFSFGFMNNFRPNPHGGLHTFVREMNADSRTIVYP